MSLVFNILAKIFKRVSDCFVKLAQTKVAHERLVQRASSCHDMMRHPDEPYYDKQYMHWIRQTIGDGFKDFVSLDLCCGQGRLTLPIAELSK